MVLIPLYLVPFFLLPSLETVFFLQDSSVVMTRVVRTNIPLWVAFLLKFWMNFSNSLHLLISKVLHLQNDPDFLDKVLWDLSKKSTLQGLVVMIAELQVELLSEAVNYN